MVLPLLGRALAGRAAGRAASRAGRGRAGRNRGGGRVDLPNIPGGGSGADEERIYEAIDEMYSLVGNAGQEAILDEAMDVFMDWAHIYLESPGGNDLHELLLGTLGADKYDATDDIWEYGESIVAEGTGFHDSEDEGGEGQGA